MKIKSNNYGNTWENKLLLGNGKIGVATDFSPFTEVININHELFWTGHGDRKAKKVESDVRENIISNIKDKKFDVAEEMIKENYFGKWTDSYLPVGNVDINVTGSNVSNFEKCIDVVNGVAYANYVIDDNKISKECFVDYCTGDVYYKLDCEKPEEIKIKLNITNGEYNVTDTGVGFIAKSYVYDETVNHQYDMDNRFIEDVYGSQRISGVLQVIKDGKVVNIKDCLVDNVVVLENVTTLIVKIQLDSEASDVTEYDEVKTKHTEMFSKQYNKSSFSVVPKNETERKVYEMYCYSKYLLISSSSNCTLPMNLQGIWNEQEMPPWRSNFTINMNLPMCYFPVLTLNMVEQNDVLIDFIREVSKKGEITARDMYNCDGWVLHHNSDRWYQTYPVKGDSSWAYWIFGGAWLCTHIYEQYIHTLDKEFLQKNIDLIEGCVTFYLEHCGEDVITAPSTSPENKFYYNNGEYSVCMQSTQDLVMLKELYIIYLKSMDALNIKNDKYDKAKRIVSKLEDIYYVNKNGAIAEWDCDYEEVAITHRHLSHLLSVYPFNYTYDEKYFDAFVKTMEIRDSDRRDMCGWSECLRACVYSRLGKKEDYIRKIESIINNQMFDNYMGAIMGEDKRGVFQLDANMGLVSAINEGMLQSHKVYDGCNVIDINYTNYFSDYQLENYRMRNNVLVDIVCKNDKIVYVKTVGINSKTIINVNGETIISESDVVLEF